MSSSKCRTTKRNLKMLVHLLIPLVITLFSTGHVSTSPTVAPLLQVVKTTSTSVNISWNDISSQQWQSELSRGFIIDVTSDGTMMKEVNLSYPMFWNEIQNLTYFTLYNITIACFNEKGVGPSSVVKVRTEEHGPQTPPSAFEVVLTSTNYINITWKPLLTENVTEGVLRGYTIFYKALYSENDLVAVKYSHRKHEKDSLYVESKRRYTKGLLLEEQNITLEGANKSFYLLQNLFGNTYYEVSIAAYTTTAGSRAKPTIVLTKPSKPLISALNLTCRKTFPKGIHIEWSHVPPAYLQGVLLGYTVYYSSGTRTVSESVEKHKDHVYLLFLEIAHRYHVWVSAFTAVGEGNHTEKITCNTAASVPQAAPANLSATSFYSPTSTNIYWTGIDNTQWFGVPRGYVVIYTLVTIGGLQVPGRDRVAYVMDPSGTWFHLTGLEVYAGYEIQVAGYNKVGIGKRSKKIYVETCRVPHETLNISYYHSPPYVIHRKGYAPSGLIVNEMEASILKCSKHCLTFSQDVSLSYKETELPMKNTTTLSESSFLVPTFRNSRQLGANIFILRSPGAVLLYNPFTAKEKSTGDEKIFTDAFRETLGLLVVFVLFNVIAGALHSLITTGTDDVEYDGHGASLVRMIHGMHLMVTLATTVGYGNKLPSSSCCNRMFFLIWISLSMILTSLMVGRFSSLFLKSLHQKENPRHIKNKVLTLYNSDDYHWVKRYFHQSQAVLSYEDIFVHLRHGREHYAVIDQYTARYFTETLTKYQLYTKYVFKNEFQIGFSAFNGLERMKKCLHDNILHDERNIYQNLTKFLQANRSPPRFHVVNKYQTTHLVNPQGRIFKYLVICTFLLLCVGIFFGIFYDIVRSVKDKKSKARIRTEREVIENRYSQLKSLKKELLHSWRDLIDSSDSILQDLEYKHLIELIAMRNQLSRKFKINLKYVLQSEILLPCDTPEQKFSNT